MTLHIVALETKRFKNKYYSIENVSKQAGFTEKIAADHILKQCIEDCQKARFTADIVLPVQPIFEGWDQALPDLPLLKTCFQFLSELQDPAEANISLLPWWVKNASSVVTIVDSTSVKEFTTDAHECKFFEVFLANIVSGNAVSKFIELGEFLDLSALNDCSLFAWSQDK